MLWEDPSLLHVKLCVTFGTSDEMYSSLSPYFEVLLTSFKHIELIFTLPLFHFFLPFTYFSQNLFCTPESRCSVSIGRMTNVRLSQQH